MLKRNLYGVALELPNRLRVTVLGLADDTTIVIKSDESKKRKCEEN